MGARGRCKKKPVAAVRRPGRPRRAPQSQGRGRGRGRCAVNARTNRCSKTGTRNPEKCKVNPSGRCAFKSRQPRVSTQERRRRQISADRRMAERLANRELGAIHRANIERERQRRNRGTSLRRTRRIRGRPVVNLRSKILKTGTASQKLSSVQKKDCFDYIMFDDENIKEYLKEDKNNFVTELNGKLECQNLDNLKKQHGYKSRRSGEKRYKVWYECKRADPDVYGPNSIKKDKKFIKVGSSSTVVKMPKWFKGPLTSSRVYKLVKDRKVPALVSSNVLNGDNVVGADHCNHTAPVQTYKIKNIK